MDLTTLKGYKLQVMCQEVKDLVTAAVAAGTGDAPRWDDCVVAGVGAGGWWGGPLLRARVSELLQQMCEGRLMRTPWLDQVCGVPGACWVAVAMLGRWGLAGVGEAPRRRRPQRVGRKDDMLHSMR
jgi:hypothetical protein